MIPFCKQCEEFHELYLKADKEALIAIQALWLLDTHPEAREALQRLGLWGKAECSDSQIQQDNSLKKGQSLETNGERQVKEPVQEADVE